MTLKYKINYNDNFFTVISVLKGHFGVSTRLLSRLNKMKIIYLNGTLCYLNNTVKVGDVISFSLDYEEDNSNIIPVKMNLNIIYEDDAIIIVDKPPFMAIHPTSYHLNDTLSNGIKYYFDKIGLKKKIRPVNRLDRNTSGLVIFAKNEYVQEHFIRQMSSGSFIKKYLGITNGTLIDLLNYSYINKICLDSGSTISCIINDVGNVEGFISAPISRKEGSIIERKVDKNGFPSKTYFKEINKYSNNSIVEFSLETGRTHQIRVHTKFIGHSLLGDTLYGSSSSLINRQALHSHFISFTHPITGIVLEFKSKLPKDIQDVINNMS